MFIPIAIVALVGVYVNSFKEEFDQENIKSVLVLVGAVFLLMLVFAVLTSFGSSTLFLE